MIQRVLIFLLLTQSLYAMARPLRELSSETIGVRTFAFHDAIRNRPVTVEFWYPIEKTNRPLLQDELIWVHPHEARDSPIPQKIAAWPLILMSHGYGGDRRDRSWLAELLVQGGFLVASIDHHGNTGQTLNPIATLKFWERPQDVVFALDQLLVEKSLKGVIDPNRIGFAGYSLGGMTGLALAGAVAEEIEEVIDLHKEEFSELPAEALSKIDFSPAKRNYLEKRIKAILLLAPATWCFCKTKNLNQMKTPIALVATLTDEVLSFEEHLQPLIAHSIPVRLKILRNGANHYSFLNCATEKGKKLLQERFYRDPPGVDRHEIHRDIGAFSIEFFRSYLKTH